MENITFDEDKDLDVKKKVEVAMPSGLVGFLITRGWASDAKTANVIIAGVVVLLFLVTGAILYASFNPEEKVIPNVRDIPFNQV